MTPLARATVLVLMSVLAGSAAAQVYRCGDEKTYTDKPCHGATGVDTRPNLLDAGPRSVPGPAQAPAPAVIPPAATPPPTSSSAASRSIWQRKDSRDAAHTDRTYR